MTRYKLIKLQAALFCLSFFLGLSLALPVELLAIEREHRAHLKYRLSSLHFSERSALSPGDRSVAHLNSLDIRSVNRFSQGAFELELDKEILAVGGSAIRSEGVFSELEQARIGEERLPNDDRRLFRLSRDFESDGNFLLTSRLDRAALAYLGQDTTLRIGRQAVSFGNGLAFQVLDLVNPFSPFTIDKEYKTGDDLAYAQYVFTKGDSLELAVVPRRNPDTRDVEEEEGSGLIAFNTYVDRTQTDLQVLSGRHYGDWFSGISTATPALQGVFRSDFRLTRLSGDAAYRLSAVANYDRSWFLLDKNMYGFIEYYRNSFGKGDVNLTSLQNDADLIGRIARGDTFALGRDLLAVGNQIEMHPLVNFYLTFITNLNDASTFLQNRVEIDAGSDVFLTLGTNVPIGGRDSEFGGVRLPDGQSTRPPFEMFARAGVYW